MASIGVSEMLGNPIKLSGATRSAPSASSPATFETVALFGKKKAAPPPPSKKAAAAVTPANDELAKWYGPDRRIFLPKGLLDRSKILPYLTGEVPGDKKPEDIAKILDEVENLATNYNETEFKLYCFCIFFRFLVLEFELKIYFVFEY
ncbi:chlorophyll a-b binding protein CP26, chloroplastic-like [Arachis duranensis]|uniref:Chlorophyll a-b binding protein CP26, chloroplastic-like n=1 Tax=Arachis duranensis TaxID=130453 RepID=A0A9C6TS20_ARADU|nr:chlorophyll a-b binding protein CP26, chloroplastic-like [Arachis duranensis]XP_052113893.1 chlorophyll a-b binding protein CP26, chloroplastic-like [Arachis duranensis]XP_052113895.1 chlorophyll a-b binding protein CP26, chloroplastic-like [Arachis duranensis]